MGADIGWTDFELRNYDAQIGRWVQMDPYDQFASGYLSMGDDPVSGIDLQSKILAYNFYADPAVYGGRLATAVGVIVNEFVFTKFPGSRDAKGKPLLSPIGEPESIFYH